jgi:Fic family protein
MGNPESKLDPHQIDSQYAGFPPFADWATCGVNLERWERACSRLRQHRQSSPEAFKKALNIVSRATAVDTGAIENLYETDRGFTFTVAMELASWEAAVEERGANVRPLLEAQFNAYDYVLDLATTKTPLSETWIRELHAVMCAGQETYTVSIPSIGVQKHILRKGEYKANPNHVRQKKDGKVHAYAPVDLTADEMYRLMLEIRSEAFQKAHPALQAAYAHYAFVSIHPFADGNGRVARALASVFTLRAESVPVLVLFDTRAEYYEALQAADQKDYQPFVDFMFNRSLEGIELVSQSFETVIESDLEGSIQKINSFYSTKSGFDRLEIEQAGQVFVKNLANQIAQKASELGEKRINLRVDLARFGQVGAESYFQPGEPGGFRVLGTLQPPVYTTVNHDFTLFIPTNPDLEDEIYVQKISEGSESPERYACRVDEVLPTMKSATQIRIVLMAERIVRRLVKEMMMQALPPNLR